jgi:hypothetical protein
MGRPKKTVPAPIEPKDISQDVPDEEPAKALETLSRGAVSQSDAARAALNAGYDKPAEAVVYIKDKFGIDMDPQYFSAVKSRVKNKEETPRNAAAPATKAKPGRKPGPAAIEGYVSPPEKPKTAGEPDVLLALEGVKKLVNQFGADKVRRMVDLLG